MSRQTTDYTHLKKILIRILRWLIPIGILYLIFQYIDFDRLFESVINTDPWFMAIGLAHFPLLIFIAALRWRYLLAQYHQTRIPLSYATRHYWIGLALGFLSPGFIGLDAYRVVVSSRRYGQTISNTAIIFVEKLIALITCMSIIVCLYPILPIEMDEKLEQIIMLAYVLLIISLVLVGVLFIFTHNKVLSKLIDRLDSFFTRTVQKYLKGFNKNHSIDTSSLSLAAAFSPFASPSHLVTIGVLSFGIQFVSAVKSQIFFYALGYDLPFMVNLFVTPTLYFIFMLPISLGSLGIREGAYILLYGLFGVPAEIALLVSFFNLSGMLFNNMIGGITMLLHKKDNAWHKPI